MPRSLLQNDGRADPLLNFIPPVGLQTAYLLLTIAVVAEVVATSALKASDGLARPGWIAVMAVGYAIAFVCLALCLKVLKVGVAYALWSGLGIVLIAFAAWVIYGESLDLAGLVGIGLILSGVVVINLFSRVSVH